MSRAREVSKVSTTLVTLESSINSNFENFETDIAYSSASPVSASTGQVWIDSTDNNAPLVKVYNGTTWVEVSGAGGGGDPIPQSLLLGGI